MKSNETRPRKSNFNSNRACYLTVDGKHYCYQYWDDVNKRTVTLKLEVGKDLSPELTLFLDESDHDMGLKERYERERRDSLFDAKAASCASDSSDEDAVDPWDKVADKRSSPETILFSEPEQENPKVAQVRRIIDEECTEAQRKLFYLHFGEKKQLEEIRQDEAKRTGKAPSAQAMTNRKNKLINKVAKFFGVERMKRRKSTKEE